MARPPCWRKQAAIQPPGTATGGQWKSFTSLGVAAGRGPLFAASLVPGKGGVNGSSSLGVTRSFTADRIAWRATLSDNSQAVIKTEIP